MKYYFFETEKSMYNLFGYIIEKNKEEIKIGDCHFILYMDGNFEKNSKIKAKPSNWIIASVRREHIIKTKDCKKMYKCTKKTTKSIKTLCPIHTRGWNPESLNNKNKHLSTIKKHRKEVRKVCFKMGIPLQGILHDLSKYSKEEMSICEWYVGTKSPHAICREQLGYSPSWPHHYHKNKHHWQYWLDIEDWPDRVYPIKMPYKYVIEMFADFIGAGKAYMNEKWTLRSPVEYYLNSCKGKRLMHSDSEALLESLLFQMSDFSSSEEEFYKWYKENKKELIEEYYEGDE